MIKFPVYYVGDEGEVTARIREHQNAPSWLIFGISYLEITKMIVSYFRKEQHPTTL